MYLSSKTQIFKKVFVGIHEFFDEVSMKQLYI